MNSEFPRVPVGKRWFEVTRWIGRVAATAGCVTAAAACHPDFKCEDLGTCGGGDVSQDTSFAAPEDGGEGSSVGATGETESSSVVTTGETASESATLTTSDSGARTESSSDSTSDSTATCDGGVCPPCTPDGNLGCSAERRFCVELSGAPQCVECKQDFDCRVLGQGEVCLEHACAACDPEEHAGCGAELPYCVSETVADDGAGGEPPDASVSTEPAEPAASVAETARCVQCLTEGDCGGETPACVNHTCVECDRDEQCGDVSASVCNLDSNTCVPCSAVGQCAHLPNTAACDVEEGRCVECTREEQGACAGPNPATTLDDGVCVTIAEDEQYQTCSAQAPTTTTQCGECVSDAQCAAGFRCVPEVFKVPSSDAGVEATGKHYCMRLEDTLGEGRRCEPNNRPFIGSFVATSEGGETGTYCRPAYTTCEAYNAWRTGPDIIPEGQGAGQATCLGNDSCGLPGVDDGFCIVANPNTNPPTNLCTYECASELDCKGNTPCNFVNPPDGLLAGNGVCSVTTTN